MCISRIISDLDNTNRLFLKWTKNFILWSFLRENSWDFVRYFRAKLIVLENRFSWHICEQKTKTILTSIFLGWCCIIVYNWSTSKISCWEIDNKFGQRKVPSKTISEDLVFGHKNMYLNVEQYSKYYNKS